MSFCVYMYFRQFLFREADIGRPKSLTASGAVSVMNPALNIKPYEAKCAPETEELFSDTFYSGLSVSSSAIAVARVFHASNMTKIYLLFLLTKVDFGH